MDRGEMEERSSKHFQADITNITQTLHFTESYHTVYGRFDQLLLLFNYELKIRY